MGIFARRLDDIHDEFMREQAFRELEDQIPDPDERRAMIDCWADEDAAMRKGKR